jgi:hypothetical protein
MGTDVMAEDQVECVAHCWVGTALPTDKAMANAHLIAAAPDLYAALDETLDALLWALDKDGWTWEAQPQKIREAIKSADAALAKARGET